MRRITNRMGSAEVLILASSAGLASLAMNFWIPFIPLYMLHLGAADITTALFWVGVAMTGQGIARAASGVLWGVLSDRLGRKLMLIRALFFATPTTMIAAFATEPWHVAIAFACQGLFSGFIPATVALTSVIVPEEKLGSSLGLVTGAQYLGNTLGPAAGAGLAIIFGLRGAIFAAAIMPAIAAMVVLLAVPRDHVAPKAITEPGETLAKGPSIGSLMTFQFTLALFLCFFLFAITQLVRLTTPVVLDDILAGESTGVIGIAFTVGGLASVIGVLFIARKLLSRPGAMRKVLVGSVIAAGLLHILLAVSMNVYAFVAVFALISLVTAAMLPASNTLIASNAPRERRGSAFGLAGTAQALAFIVGPMSAALFAAISLQFGFVVLGVMCFALAVLLGWKLREPALVDEPPATGQPAPPGSPSL